MIQVEQVGVVSGGVALLDPVSLDVSRGEALVVRGSNGAGKSTLLRVLAGARTPTSGSARIADTVVTEGDRMLRRRVSTMIGLPPMAVDLTVRDHVLLVATTWVDDGDAAAELADGVLAELGIDWLGERYPHELSSGQTQLFGLALVLARPFDVLILDEPEQRLDPEHVEAVIEVLRARREAGATLVIATHSAVLADALADQTVVLKRAA
ncbi:ABC-type multidrug transport system ATPase subunit [Microbacterium keratanolyticum]|uniref:Multidrug ABC transporter ATP-binding protein n=1 Tax=Microbacterium keratanolyticum TaxID=67574 RepID=A0A9W6M6Y6_9MICO|nr:ABC transporter ATP-binding protein [Microbacterium keratanolyticum]MBM7468351.1 ABC-type multidrug transport system ATPase subunit [Microbacterium keratanolyticum]GLK00425.1 multidrug ABC transporter ATP-binding protein [Microbacterium keratanolyticum]